MRGNEYEEAWVGGLSVACARQYSCINTYVLVLFWGSGVWCVWLNALLYYYMAA